MKPKFNKRTCHCLFSSNDKKTDISKYTNRARVLIWLNISSGAFRGCASALRNYSSLSALTWPIQVCPLWCCGRDTDGSISLIAVTALALTLTFWSSQRFSANLLWRNFPLMNFIPFHAGGILRSLSMYVRVREGIFISALGALCFTEAGCLFG